MSGAEGIVLALGAFGEAGEPATLPQGTHAVAPAGEDLMRIGLMADVPDQPVARRVEQIMQRYRQLDHTQPRAEMAAGDGYGVDGFPPQLLSLIHISEPTRLGMISYAVFC